MIQDKFHHTLILCFTPVLSVPSQRSRQRDLVKVRDTIVILDKFTITVPSFSGCDATRLEDGVSGSAFAKIACLVHLLSGRVYKAKAKMSLVQIKSCFVTT